MHPQQRSASDDARVMTPEDELFGEFLAAIYRRIISLSPVFAPVFSYSVGAYIHGNRKLSPT